MQCIHSFGKKALKKKRTRALDSNPSIWIKTGMIQNNTIPQINTFTPLSTPNSKQPGERERKITFPPERPAPIKILNVSYTKSTGLLADY